MTRDSVTPEEKGIGWLIIGLLIGCTCHMYTAFVMVSLCLLFRNQRLPVLLGGKGIQDLIYQIIMTTYISINRLLYKQSTNLKQEDKLSMNIKQDDNLSNAQHEDHLFNITQSDNSSNNTQSFDSTKSYNQPSIDNAKYSSNNSIIKTPSTSIKAPRGMIITKVNRH